MSSSIEYQQGADEWEEQRALVALSLVPGVGPGRIRSLLSRFGSGRAALHASRSSLEQVPGIGAKTAAAIRQFDADGKVHAQMERARQADAALLAVRDERYPRLLRQIYDPPAFLWMRGRLHPDDDQALAVVGTRRCTDYGRRIARRLAGELAARGFTIVSGLAYGIDAAAHRGALEAGGRTIAVLGSGVDRIYPQQHAGLARHIAEQGALLSEYPLGAAPDAANFPRRNRIVSGMCVGTVVIESFESGGALITARLALEQDREVFAVPSPLGSAAGVGSNRLIQQGHAKLVLTVEDILEELPYDAAPSQESVSEERDAPPPDLNVTEQLLLDALSDDPVPVDVLCERTNLDPATALVYLLSLEFKGLARQLAGKQFLRA